MRRFGKEIGVRDWVSGNRYWVLDTGSENYVVHYEKFYRISE